MRAPKDYDFQFTAQGINYYLGVIQNEDYELQIIKQNPSTKDWDNIVIGWGTNTLYDLQSGRYTVEEMVASMCRVFNKKVLGISEEGDVDQIPDGLPEVLTELMTFIRDRMAYSDATGLTIK